MVTEITQGLALLRAPFDERNIGKLPKPTKQQTDEVKADYRKGVRCDICHTWHHPKVVHLDYVGHAALTDRLLDADPLWFWEPMSFDGNGLPMRDGYGGLWIRLTVCGHSRIGYGHTDKTGGDAVKEIIGDALRNAAMRFGAALDLWHKGELHRSQLPEPSGDESGQGYAGEPAPRPASPELPPYPPKDFATNLPTWQKLMQSGETTADKIIAKVSTRGVLSDEQQAAIRDCAPVAGGSQE